MKKPSPRRVTMLLLAGLALLLFQYYFLLRAGLLNDRLAAILLHQINAQLAGQILVERVEGDPLRSLTLWDLRILDAEGVTLLEVRRGEAKWSLTAVRPRLMLRVENAFVRAEKREGVWNFRRLRPARAKRERAAVLPSLEVGLTVINSRLELSWSPAREIEAYIPRGRLDLILSGSQIHYVISEFQAAVAEPALGINGFTGKGEVISTAGGWEYHLAEGELITASSLIHVKDGRYFPPTRAIGADFPSFKIAPDTLALFWPRHPLALPVQGSASARGAINDVSFTAQLSSSAGGLSLQGVIRERGRQGRMRGEMDDFSLGEFLAAETPLSGLSGKFSWDYDYTKKSSKKETKTPATTQPRQRHHHLRLELTRFDYPSINSFPLELELDLRQDDFSGRLESSNPGGELEAKFKGALTPARPLWLQARFQEINPVFFRAGLPEGSLSGEFTLEGRGQDFSSFHGRAEVLLLSSVFRGLSFDRLESTAELEAGRITFDRIALLAPGTEVHGRGWMAPAESSFPFSFELEAEAAEPGRISSFFQDRFRLGSIKGTLSLKGNRSQWTATGTLQGREMAAGVFRAEAAEFNLQLAGAPGRIISGEITVHGERLSLPGARYGDFQLPTFDLHSNIVLPPSRSASLAADFNLHTLSAASGFGLQARGTFGRRVSAAGWHLDLRSLSLELLHRSYEMEKPTRLTSSKAGLEIDSFALAGPGERISAAGRFWGPTVDLHLQLDRFQLAPWTTSLFPGSSIEAALSGTVTIHGPAAAPGAEAEVETAGGGYGRLQFERVRLMLAHRPVGTDFQLTAALAEGGELHASGRLPLDFSLRPARLRLRREQEMKLALEAPGVSAALLESLLGGVTRAEGRFSLSATLSGPAGAPEWNGGLSLENVGFYLPAWGLEMSALNGRAEIVRNEVSLTRLSVRAGEGRAELSGTMRLKGFSLETMDLALHTEKFRAMQTPEILAVVDADLRFRGDLSRPVVDGKVEFSELVYRPPLLLEYQGSAWEAEDETIRLKGEKPRRPRPSPLLDRTDLRVKLEIPDRGLVKNSEMNIRFGGSLEVRKPGGGFFLFSGELESREGFITFQGKPFHLEHGRFFFPPIPAIDPDLDILASYRVPDYLTYIRIGGRLSAPTLEIYSEPPLDPADVLAVILFGRPVEELGAGEQNALASAGSNILGGYAASALARSLEETLRIDTIILQPGESAETSGVGFGTYLSERLYLFYYHRFGEAAAEEFKLRYELHKNVSLEAGQDEKGQGGVDLFYRRSFGRPAGGEGSSVSEPKE